MAGTGDEGYGRPNGTRVTGSRGMHSASIAYWDNTTDGTWTHQFQFSHFDAVIVVRLTVRNHTPCMVTDEWTDQLYPCLMHLNDEKASVSTSRGGSSRYTEHERISKLVHSECRRSHHNLMRIRGTSSFTDSSVGLREHKRKS